MNAPALRPLSSGELLDLSFRLYRQLFAPLVMVQLVCASLPFLIAIYVEQSASGSVGLTFLSYVINFVLGALAAAATTFIVSEAYLGRSLGAGDALRRALPYLPPVAGLSMLVALVTGTAALPFLLLVGAMAYAVGQRNFGFAFGLFAVALATLALPAFIFAALSVATQCLVLEEGPKPIRAMGRSWRLTAGHRLKITLLVLAFVLLLMIPVVALGVLAGILTGDAGEAGATVGVVITAIGLIGTFVATPAIYCLFVLLYYDLRVRKEGFDLELLAAALGRA